MNEHRSSVWNLSAPPGFRGLDDQREVAIYMRRLPHWRQDGATYFVTFRLADSLPKTRLRELDAMHAELEQRYPPPRSRDVWERIARAGHERIERWLDESHGACVLAEPRFAAHVVQAMHHFDNERYELSSYVVMPNHVHALVRPMLPQRFPLEAIVGSWKQFSSSQIGRAIGNRGNLWQEETHDRIVRDEEHLYRVLQYIGRNPSKAGLPPNACPMWVRPDWEKLGWRFEFA